MKKGKAVLGNDMKAFAATGEKGWMETLMTTHTGNDHRRV
jgi:hypothetical protein